MVYLGCCNKQTAERGVGEEIIRSSCSLGLRFNFVEEKRLFRLSVDVGVDAVWCFLPMAWHVGQPWLSGDDVNQERIAVSRPLVPFLFYLSFYFILFYFIAVPRTVCFHPMEFVRVS